MRVMYEPWFVKYKVDVVFAGHVHAYERTVSGQIISPARKKKHFTNQIQSCHACYFYFSTVLVILSKLPRMLIVLSNSVSCEIRTVFGAFLCVSVHKYYLVVTLISVKRFRFFLTH